MISSKTIYQLPCDFFKSLNGNNNPYSCLRVPIFDIDKLPIVIYTSFLEDYVLTYSSYRLL